MKTEKVEKVEKFKAAVANAAIRPKGIKIHPEFWKDLENEQLIQMRKAGVLGICFLSDSPFYDNDIFLIHSPELMVTGDDFELPPSSKKSDC